MTRFFQAIPSCFRIFVQIYLYGTAKMAITLEKAEQIQAITLPNRGNMTEKKVTQPTPAAGEKVTQATPVSTENMTQPTRHVMKSKRGLHTSELADTETNG